MSVITEKPILFSGEMVKALLAGRKSQTRRIIKGNHDKIEAGHKCDSKEFYVFEHAGDDCDGCEYGCGGRNIECRYGKPGDHLWVKETFAKLPCSENQDVPCLDCQNCRDGRAFRADGQQELKWKPSIFMPRWASRITLEITAVRVERLQEISMADVMAEGCLLSTSKTEPLDYQNLWNSINLKPSPVYARYDQGGELSRQIYSYQSFPWSNADFDAKYPGVRETGLYRGKPITVTENPWVWVVAFQRVDSEKLRVD